MSSVEEELSNLDKADQSFQGHSTDDIAKALQSYAEAHKGEGFPVSLSSVNPTASISTPSASSIKMNALASASTATITSGTYSWAAILINVQWARVIYSIIWIVFGLTLLFFGYASLYWFKEAGSKNRNHADASKQSPGRHRHRHQRHGKRKSLLSGGIGGVFIGFLFFSYLAALINNALCVDNHKSALSSGAFFAIWLTSGLLGGVVGGYFYFMAKVMAGILAGTSFTLIMTAMFGIESIFIRVILLGVSSSLLTAPLLLPKMNLIQKIILNICTSLIGVVTFLNGVALFAPPVKASSNWLDLWTMLFCSNGNAAVGNLTQAWGTSAFKGYIAGAVLGSAIGFLFEQVLHSQSGHDADSEWNEYLGNYTQRYDSNDNPFDNEKGLAEATSMAAKARAGLFEPTPNAWQRMIDFFDSEAGKSAHYGNLSGNGIDMEEASIVERTKRNRYVKRRGRSGKGTQPARFTPISKRDEFDEDSSLDQDDQSDSEDDQLTNIGSTDEEKKDREIFFKGSPSKGLDEQSYDDIHPTSPSIRMSQMSGTTLKNSTQGSKMTTSQQEEKTTSPSQKTTSPSQNSVPATPSLINAITRVQQAQQAALAWQKEQRADGSPSKTTWKQASPKSTP